MLLSRDQQNEADDINNLLYLLHTTPIIDHLGLAEIAAETQKDGTLKKKTKLIKNAKTMDSKNSSFSSARIQKHPNRSKNNGEWNLFKVDRIILPKSLQEKAIALAHCGSHPGQSGMERRLNYHFFSYNMLEKV